MDLLLKKEAYAIARQKCPEGFGFGTLRDAVEQRTLRCCLASARTSRSHLVEKDRCRSEGIHDRRNPRMAR